MVKYDWKFPTNTSKYRNQTKKEEKHGREKKNEVCSELDFL